RRLIEEEIGIHLGDGKRALLVARLSRRLRQGGFQTFHDYFRHVTEVDGEEKTRMFDAVCTNETQFFRAAKNFRFLEGGGVRAWCASAPPAPPPPGGAFLRRPFRKPGPHPEGAAADHPDRLCTINISTCWWSTTRRSCARP